MNQTNNYPERVYVSFSESGTMCDVHPVREDKNDVMYFRFTPHTFVECADALSGFIVAILMSPSNRNAVHMVDCANGVLEKMLDQDDEPENQE